MSMYGESLNAEPEERDPFAVCMEQLDAANGVFYARFSDFSSQPFGPKRDGHFTDPIVCLAKIYEKTVTTVVNSDDTLTQKIILLDGLHNTQEVERANAINKTLGQTAIEPRVIESGVAIDDVSELFKTTLSENEKKELLQKYVDCYIGSVTSDIGDFVHITETERIERRNKMIRIATHSGALAAGLTLGSVAGYLARSLKKH